MTTKIFEKKKLKKNKIKKYDEMRPQVQLFVKKLNKNATLPTRGSEEAAGLDLYASQSVTIPPHSKALIPTDISIDIPSGHYGRVAPRSGLAIKNHINVGAGVIDR